MEGSATLPSAASFVITLPAPESLQWDDLVAPAISSLNRARVDERQRSSVIRHYAYLLRLHSWKHGMDWVPTQNKITVVVPNQIASRQTLEENGLVRDGLTTILKQVFGEVPLEDVLKHFEDQRETTLI